MKVIIGLGNPDKKYEKTYHNLGFSGADKAAEILGAEFSKTKFNSLIAEKNIDGEKVLIAKPLTYMNLSGDAVAEIVNFYKLDLKDLIVIYDDFDLIKGSLRIRKDGSAGTHNGMRNIIERLGTGNFARIRIGFKPVGFVPENLADFVLSGIPAEDTDLFDNAILNAGKAAADFARGKCVDDITAKYSRAVK